MQNWAKTHEHTMEKYTINMDNSMVKKKINILS